LYENTKQSLLLVIQRFKDEEIVILDDMINNYENIKIIFNVRKKKPIINWKCSRRKSRDGRQRSRKKGNKPGNDRIRRKEGSQNSFNHRWKVRTDNSSFLQDMTEDQHGRKSEWERWE